jgi:ABC-2 type transport system ATP-binding protein
VSLKISASPLPAPPQPQTTTGLAASTHPGSATIEALEVSKWFGDKVAVSDLKFSVGPGVTALLGPNGAGKSTTFKLLTGLLRPSRGQVRVLGQRVANNPPLYRRIGLVPEQDSLYGFLTAREFVELAARLHRLPNPPDAAGEALHTVDLLDAQHRKLGGFSKGMRQRVKVAQALVHDPDVLFLDEPLTGTDPRQRLSLMETFIKLGESGKTVMISSHILNEVERLGSNILVIVNGKLAAEGDFHGIRALMDDRPRRVRIGCADPRAMAAAVVALQGTRGVRLEGESVVLETGAPLEFYAAVARLAQQSHNHLYSIEGLDEDLESVFRYLVST